MKGTEEHRKGKKVTLRALLLGALLIPACQFWIFQVELVRYTFPTLVSPFYDAIFILFGFALWNLAVGGLAHRLGERAAWLRRWVFSRVELLVIYTMVSVASAYSSSDLLGILISLMGHPYRFATPENRWDTLFVSRLPRWLTVDNAEALKGYYEGHSTFFTPAHLRAWAVPILWWTLFTVVLAVCLLLVCVILRKQWIERERLTYPIVFLPLEMTDTGGASPFYRQPLLWIGFAIAAGVTLLNGFHHLFPFVPGIPIKRFRIGQYLVSSPWNAINFLQRMFYLFGIGIAFLMPLDLSISCWLFYFLYLGERVFCRAAGMDREGDFPYYYDQMLGAYVGLFGMVLWASRGYWREVWRAAVWKRGLDEAAEPLSYRLALIGLGLGGAFLLGFTVKMGMSWGVSMLFFFLYLCVAVMISRLRAEIGMPVHDMHGANVHEVLTRIGGTAAFSIQDLTAFALLHWMNRVYRSHPTPHKLEGFKLAERTDTHPRGFLTAILLALVITVPGCFLIYLDGYYHRGAETGKVEIWALGFGREMYDRLANWIANPTDPDFSRLGAAGVGCGIALCLAALRRRFPGFILHPLGYAIAAGWGMHNLWLCIFLGSVTKWLVLRYGGLRLYRRATPFFLGLILGEFLIGSGWSLLGIALDLRTYDFWP